MDNQRRVWVRRGRALTTAERRVVRHSENGNGSLNGRGRLVGDVARSSHSEPLWIRLSGLTVDGGGTGLLPEVARVDASARQSWLSDLGARAHTAIAARADIAIQVVLLVGVGFVLATNVFHWPATQFDEGTYVSYSWAVGHGKLANYTYSYGHPPLAWILIFVWTWARGILGHLSFSIDESREFMVAVCLVSCSLLYILARRLAFGRVFASLAVLLFALSPLALWFHRAVLLDNPSIAWALGALVLARTPQRRLWAFAGGGACFAAAVLCKETTLILLPALLLAAYDNRDPRTARYCLTLLVCCFFFVAATYPLYATLKGELLPGRGHVSLLGYAVIQLFTRQGTGSPFNPASESHAIVAGWLRLDPWLLGSALALCPIALVRRTTRAVALAFLLQVATVLRPGYLPNMYVIGLLPFAALVVAGSAEALWRRWRALAQRVLAWAFAALMVVPVGALAVNAASRWRTMDSIAMSSKSDAATRAAEKWIVLHIPRDKRLIVSDDFWLYLIEHGHDSAPMRGGFYSRTVVSYWPLDYDPAARRAFPRGWRGFDYVISTESMRDDTARTPTTADALVHSRVLATFGRGTARIEIRQIVHPPQPAG